MSEVKTNKITSLASNNDITLDPDGTGAVVVDAGHSLGVGTASPESFYSLADDIVLGTGSGGRGLTIYSGSSDSGYIGFNDTASASMQGFIQYNHNGDYMALAPNGSEKVRIDSSGNVTMANQPSVSARATATNLAVGSQTTLTLDNERYDIGSNLASNTFTAPVTGKYLFTYTLYFVDVDTDNTALGVQVITSNTQYENWISPDHIGNSDFFYTATSAQIADMDANDTLQFKVYVSAGAAQTDVHPDSKISIALLS